MGKRIKKHNNGTGAKYTRAKGPVELVYVEELKNKIAAARREYEIKQFSKEQKEILVKEHNKTYPNE